MRTAGPLSFLGGPLGEGYKGRPRPSASGQKHVQWRAVAAISQPRVGALKGCSKKGSSLPTLCCMPSILATSLIRLRETRDIQCRSVLTQIWN
jgi:hypothetical protein